LFLIEAASVVSIKPPNLVEAAKFGVVLHLRDEKVKAATFVCFFLMYELDFFGFSQKRIEFVSALVFSKNYTAKNDTDDSRTSFRKSISILFASKIGLF
jgi:hypothetical protein